MARPLHSSSWRSRTPTSIGWSCATMQLAWDEMRQKAGTVPRVEGDPPLAAALNRRPFPRSALAPESYVARMGAVRDGVVDAIRAELNRKFPNTTPSLLESRDP